MYFGKGLEHPRKLVMSTMEATETLLVHVWVVPRSVLQPEIVHRTAVRYTCYGGLW